MWIVMIFHNWYKCNFLVGELKLSSSVFPGDEHDYHPQTAENILKSLGIDYDEPDVMPQLSISSSQPASPRRRLCNGKIHKLKSALEAEEGIQSSDDSIDGSPSKKLSPHRRKATSNNSIIPATRPQQNSVLRVPISDHRPSSIGSISPRSYDGSDSQSSPTHIYSSPIRTPRLQPTVRPVIQKTSNHKSNSTPKSTSVIIRATPISSSVREGCSVTAAGEQGVVQWIGYEEVKPDRYFAGVKLVCLLQYCIKDDSCLLMHHVICLVTVVEKAQFILYLRLVLWSATCSNW